MVDAPTRPDADLAEFKEIILSKINRANRFRIDKALYE
jgi:hypothetical protein